VIAERAARNFLVAAMSAFPLSIAREILDPAARGFDPAGIPSRIGEALGKYLDRLPEQRRERDRGLLTALAYARGAGLDDSGWLAFAAALGYDATVADLEVMRRSVAADYLLQTSQQGTRSVTGLFHQALADELLAVRSQPGDESRLLDVLLSEAGRTGWHGGYARDHAAGHASAAGRLDELLEDPLYMVTVDPGRLVPYLDTARSAEARASAAVYRQTAHIIGALDLPMRVSQLELTGYRLGFLSLAARIAAVAPDRPWRVRWSRGHRATEHQIVVGRQGAVDAVAVGALADGTPVVVSGGNDRTVRIWRLADGSPVGEPLRGHEGGVFAVAVGALADGTPVVVSSGDDATVRIWQLADGAPVGEPLSDHDGEVHALAVGVLADGMPILVTGGDDGTVRIWQLADWVPVGEPLRGHGDIVRAVTVGVLADGTPVVVSGGDDGAVLVWRMADGSPVGEPLRAPDFGVYTVAVGSLADGTPVVVSGGYDGLVRIWRLADGSPAGEPLSGHDGTVLAVAVGSLADGTPVVVSGGDDRLVRVWRLEDGAPMGEPLRGHEGGVFAVAVGALADGIPVVVSVDGAIDKTVRVWRLADGTHVGEPLSGHEGEVRVVAVGALADGTPVAVSAEDYSNQTVRVWRLADGSPVGKPLLDLDHLVNAVKVGAKGEEGEAPVQLRLGAAAEGETPVQITFGVSAVAVGTLPDGTPVAVSGGAEIEGSVQVWQLADGRPVGEPLRGHSGGVSAVAVGALMDGTPVVVSGGDDEMVWMWGLSDGIPLVPRLNLSQLVRGIAVRGNLIVSASGTGITVHDLALSRPTGS
jgi:WD40 repeat protein